MSSSMSVNTVHISTKQSPSALVERANWNGAVAWRTAAENCCAIVRATKRRKTIPVAIPRMSPVGVPVESMFCSAVKLATARPFRNASGIFPAAMVCAKKKRLSAVLEFSNEMR